MFELASCQPENAHHFAFPIGDELSSFPTFDLLGGKGCAIINVCDPKTAALRRDRRTGNLIFA
jgi:hypothetical protein